MNPIDENPRPQGELALQTVAMPADTNANGDIFGGWLLSQMDIAGGVAAAEVFFNLIIFKTFSFEAN